MRKLVIVEAKKEFEELLNSEEFYIENIGVRFDDREFSIGEYVPNSYNQHDDVPQDEQEELDGTCAISIDNGSYFDDGIEFINFAEKRLNSACSYPGYYAYIIKGDGSNYGEDESEIIIKNAVVMAKVEIK